MDTEIDLLRDIKRLLSNNGGGNFSSSGSSGSSGGSMFDGILNKFIPGTNLLTSAAKGAAGSLDSLFRGSMDATKALDMMSGALGTLPFIGGAMGDTLKLTGQALIDTNTNLNETGKYGANFNNNVALFVDKIASAGLSQQQYIDMVKNNVETLSGLGPTINASQTVFLDMAKQFRESPVGRQLTQLGMSAEEQAQILSITASHRYNIDMSNLRAQKEATDQAIALAGSLEENTRLTGISRAKQLEDMKKASEAAEVQAAIRLLPPGAKDNFDMMNSQLETMGPAFQDLATEIFTLGIHTKKGSEGLGALPKSGIELEKAVRMMKNAHDADSKAAATAQMNYAKAAINAEMAGKAFNITATSAYNGVGDATRNFITSNKSFESAIQGQTQAINANKDASLLATQADQKRLVINEMQGKGADGKVITDPGVLLGQTVNNVNRTLGDLSAGLAKSINNVISSSNDFGTALNKLNTSILKPRSAEETAKIPGEIFDGVKSAIKSITPEVTTTSTKSADEITKPVVRKFAEGTAGMRDFLKGGGAFDNIFEKFDPKGEMVELHGEEVVANKQQMSEFRNQLVDGIQSLMKNNKTPMPSIQPQVDEIINAIQQVKPIAEPKQDESDLVKVEAKIKDMVTSFEDTKPIIEGEANKMLQNIKPPELNDVFKNINKEFKGIFDTFKLPDFSVLNDGLVDKFSEVSDKIQPPDLSPMLTDVAENFKKVTGDFQLPDVTHMFDDAATNFSSMTKDFELPDVRNIFDDAIDNLSSITDGFEFPDFSNVFNSASDDLKNIAEEIKPPDYDNMFSGITAKFTNLSSDLEPPAVDKMFSSVSESFLNIQKNQDKMVDSFKLPEQKFDLTGKLKFDNKTLDISHRPPVVTPDITQIRTHELQNPLNTAALKEHPKPKPEPSPPPPPPVQQKPMVDELQLTTGNRSTTLNEVLAQLELMNKTLAQIAMHSNETVNLTGKQIKATKGLSGNRFA